jgi:hypothetical protein
MSNCIQTTFFNHIVDDKEAEKKGNEEEVKEAEKRDVDDEERKRGDEYNRNQLIRIIDHYTGISLEYSNKIEKLINDAKIDLSFITASYWDVTIDEIYAEKYIKFKKLFINNSELQISLKNILCGTIQNLRLFQKYFEPHLSAKDINSLRNNMKTNISRY